MKIGVFTNAYKPVINGVVNCIDLIRQELTGRRHEVFIFTPSFPSYVDEEPHIYRYPSINLTSKMKFPIALPFSSKITKAILSMKLDIIHSQHPFLMGELGAGFAKRLEIPLIFTFHTQYEQYAHYIPLPGFIVKNVSKYLVRKYADKCSKIITPGSSIMKILHEYGIRDKVVHIPNAIDLSPFGNPDKKSIREKFNIQDDEKLLLYVGRMALEKNLPFMLIAFKLINKMTKARLMIIGEGPLLDNLKTASKEMGIRDNVIFTGRVEYKDIPPYYGASDMFLISSTTEVKPLALLEAMASSLPIIAVRAHGSSDTIINGVNGILTEEKTEEFAGAVLKLINDNELLLQMRENSKKTAQEFSIKTFGDKLLKLYEEAIEKYKAKNH